MKSPYEWYSAVSLIFHVSMSVVLVAILSIGWVRQRRVGFLVLIVWALVSMFSSAVTIFARWLQPFLSAMFPGADRQTLILLPNLLSLMVYSLLLALGLALLVFRKDGRRETDSPD